MGLLRVFVLVLVGGALLGGPANAAGLPSQQLAFGEPGSGPGQLTTNLGLSIGPTGLWVVDAGSDRVQLWSPAGTFLRTFGSTGSGRGEFRLPEDVAEVGGYVYVSDCYNQRVQRFTTGADHLPSGSFTGDDQGLLCPEGLAATSSGDLLVADTFHDRVLRFGPAADPTISASISVPRPLDVAVSPVTGDSYVTYGPGTACFPSGVRRYSAAGDLLGTLAEDLGCPISVTVDVAGNVYVNTSRQVHVYTATGAYAGTLPAPTGQQRFTFAAELTSDASCRLYISDRDAARIFVYGQTAEGGCTTYLATTAAIVPEGAGTAPLALTPTLKPAAHIVVGTSGTVKIGAVRCGEPVSCAVSAEGTVSSGGKRRTLVAQSFSLSPIESRRLDLRFRRAADRRAVLATIRRTGKARLKVKVVARADDGRTGITTKTVTLRR